MALVLTRTNQNSQEQLFSAHNGTVTQTFGAPLVPLLFNTVIVNTNFTPNADGSVTFNTNGNYLITFDVSFISSGNNVATSQTDIYKNGIIVPGSSAFSNHSSSTTGQQTATSSVIVSFNATDTLLIQSTRIAGSGSLSTLANGCRLNIKKMR